MKYDELMDAMAKVKVKVKSGHPDDEDEKEARMRKMIRDFWFSTGVTQKFFLTMDEESAMEMWARFVIERMEDVS